MANIVERVISDGSTSYQVRWREGGKQRARAASGATKKERKANAEHILRLVLAHGTFRDDMARIGVPTVNEQAEVFLAQHTRGNPDTVADYRRILTQHISPALGDMSVTALTVPMLTAWGKTLQSARGGPVGDKTRANITAVLSGILESAVPDWLPANPWRKVRLPKTDGPRVRNFLSAADVQLILGEVPEHYRLAVLVLALTGLRWSEASALTVADLDLSSGKPVLRVWKAFKHGSRKATAPGTPKTEKSVRFVTAPVELADLLRGAAGDRSPAAPLLPALRGGRMYNSTFHTLVWQPALDRAQAGGLRFRPQIRELRNAAVSWLLDGGMSAYEVADMMGHEDVATTLQIYRRSNPQAGLKAASAQSAIFAQIMGGRAIEAPPTST